MQLVLIAVVVPSLSIATTTTTSTTTLTTPRPNWLSGTITPEILDQYRALARERHEQAIQTARESLGERTTTTTTTTTITSTATTLPDMTPHITTRSLQNRQIPDFHSILGTTIHVSTLPFLSKEECQNVVQMAEDHQNWTTMSSGQYPVAGVLLTSVPSLRNWFHNKWYTSILPLLQRTYPTFINDTVTPASLPCVDHVYLFKYTTETGKQTGIHTDSGCLSFTMALNDEYTGGGTWFQELEDPVIEMTAGHITIRPGGLRHCGQAITNGTRYIIGGFCLHPNHVEYVRQLIGLGNDLMKSAAAQQQQQQDYVRAKEALMCAIWINPYFDGAFTHLAHVLMQLNEPKTAQEVLEYCLQHVNPNNEEVAFTLGGYYLKQDNYFDAKQCFDVCLRVNKNDVDAMMLLAQVCAGVGTKDGEASWYERIVTVPDASKETIASAYCNLGTLREGTDQEMEYYMKALELVPNHYQSRYSLGAAYASRNEWEMAATHFRLAVPLTDDKALVLTSLYKVTLKVVQSEPTQAAMMDRMQQVMGMDNYQLLAASRGK